MNRRTWVLAVTLAILAVAAVAVFAFDEDYSDKLTEWQIAITSLISGVIGVPLMQVVKKILPSWLGKRGVTYLTYAVAFVVAVVAFAVAGGWKQLISSPWSVIQSGSIVFAFMGLAYRTISERLNMGRSS